MPGIAAARGESAFAPQERSQPHEIRVAWALAAVAVLLQVLTNGGYGYFRDEHYFLACSDHLATGYVDLAFPTCARSASTCPATKPT